MAGWTKACKPGRGSATGIRLGEQNPGWPHVAAAAGCECARCPSIHASPAPWLLPELFRSSSWTSRIFFVSVFSFLFLYTALFWVHITAQCLEGIYNQQGNRLAHMWRCGSVRTKGCLGMNGEGVSFKGAEVSQGAVLCFMLISGRQCD